MIRSFSGSEATVKALWDHFRQDDPSAVMQFEHFLEKVSKNIHDKQSEKVIKFYFSSTCQYYHLIDEATVRVICSWVHSENCFWGRLFIIYWEMLLATSLGFIQF